MEKISVVITTYKRSNMFSNALKSVVNQTYKNLEIIVVDDNVNYPKERLKVEEVVKKYDNVKLIKNGKNLGGALSRNVGIENSNGELISFLDDDDIYLPNRIEKLYQIYKNHINDKPGLIYCSCSTYSDIDKNIGEYVHNYEWSPVYEQMLGCIAGTSMWLASKKALIDVGMFDQSPCRQDSIVILKLLTNNYNVFCTTERLVLYYEHNGQGISGLKIKNIEGIKIYRDLCRKNYNLISKKQIKNVENNFYSQIINIYLFNKNRKLAFEELKSMSKLGIINLYFIKAFIKCIFYNLYLKKIEFNRRQKIKNM